uniref:Regucalcin n=1 Tax=Lampyris turkestanicus TaxID=293978 RepID=E0XEM8_9COLE|nr:luciferin regenerating enzyme [Lampyris turkestanicus]
MSPTIEIVTERVILGEGPHWDVPSQSLYYVDILGQTLHKYVPSTNTHTKVKIEGGPIGFAIPVEGKPNTFAIGLGRKIVEVVWDGVSDSVSSLKTLVEVDSEAGFTNNRFNDGKADPTGRLWAGTMGPEPEVGKLEPEKGTLYTFDRNHRIKAHLKTISISNGLAWNLKLKKMYYIDSPLKTVDQYDYDMVKGEICNRKVIFDFDKHSIPGIPDGMTIDSEGNLWVAVFDGARILKINPNTSELLTTINFPTQQITCPTFGGPNLEDLYVTSGQLVIEGKTQPAPAGAVFKVTGVGSKGLPCVNVHL